VNSRIKYHNEHWGKQKAQNDFENFEDSHHSSLDNEHKELEDDYENYSKALFEKLKSQDHRSDEKMVRYLCLFVLKYE